MTDFQNLDVEILIDKSGSMATADTPSGSRWNYAQETAFALANQVAPFDPDGITVTVFAGKYRTYEGTEPSAVQRIFTENAPMGSTDTAGALKSRLDAYFARKAAGAARPVAILVLTDGVPDNEAAVAKVIVEAANKLDADEEVAISFVQVGSDGQATKFLQRLDNDLVAQGAKFDIVDTLLITDVEDLTAQELIEKAFAD